MEQPSNLTEVSKQIECLHLRTNSFEFMDYDWALEREFFVTRTICLDCNKRIY